MIRISYSADFRKRYKSIDEKIRTAFDKRLLLFVEDQFHPLLGNHSLKGARKGYRSINVTGDWRAIFKVIGTNTFYFVEIGAHHDLYGR